MPPGRGRPPPAAHDAARPGRARAGLGDQLKMPHHPTQPTRVKAVGRLHQHRLGLDGHLGSQVVGPAASTLAWAGESSPSVRAWAVPVRGPRNPPGRSEPRGRRRQRPCAAGCAASRRSSRPGHRLRPRRPPGIQLGQPVAVQAVQQPPHLRTRSARAAAHSRPRSSAASWVMAAARAVDPSGSRPGRPSGSPAESVFGSMAAPYQPPPQPRHHPPSWGQPPWDRGSGPSRQPADAPKTPYQATA
jgi:hypothetical protein